MGMKREIGNCTGSAPQLVSQQLQTIEARGSHAVYDTASRFEFWRGASGRRYIHTMHPLWYCPPVADATYVLVRREGDSRRRVLAVGRTHSDAPSLNLAEIRQKGARLGANEVHVHLIAATDRERAVIEFDLQTKLIDGGLPAVAN